MRRDAEQIMENLSAMKKARHGIHNRHPELAYDSSGTDLFEKQVIPALPSPASCWGRSLRGG